MASLWDQRVTLIEGDGIGPEISGAVVKILAAAQVSLACNVVVVCMVLTHHQSGSRGMGESECAASEDCRWPCDSTRGGATLHGEEQDWAKRSAQHIHSLGNGYVRLHGSYRTAGNTDWQRCCVSQPHPEKVSVHRKPQCCHPYSGCYGSLASLGCSTYMPMCVPAVPSKATRQATMTLTLSPLERTQRGSTVVLSMRYSHIDCSCRVCCDQ